MFLVASGFLSYRDAVPPAGADAAGDGVVRRVVRVGPGAVGDARRIMVVAAIDGTDEPARRSTRSPSWHALTYTYNWFVQETC